MAGSIIRGIHDARRMVGGLVRSVGELQLAWATAGRLGDTRSPFDRGVRARVATRDAFHSVPMDVRFGI